MKKSTQEKERIQGKIVDFMQEFFKRNGQGIFWLENSHNSQIEIEYLLEKLVNEYIAYDYNIFMGIINIEQKKPGLLFIDERLLRKQDIKSFSFQILKKTSLDLIKGRDLSKCGYIIDVESRTIINFPFT